MMRLSQRAIVHGHVKNNAAASPVAELCDCLLYVVVEASSPSVEHLRLEVVQKRLCKKDRLGS